MFPCQQCNIKFSSKRSLHYHNKTKHDESNQNKCNICGKVLSCKSALATHNRTHTAEKPFVCPTCGKAFNQKSSLNRHQSTHSMLSFVLQHDLIVYKKLKK